MNRYHFTLILIYLFTFSYGQQKKTKDTFLLQPVEVIAIRASENAPFAKKDFNAKEIAINNTGRDLPFIIQQTPSVQVNSDAGNGIGYTGIRIRGTDATRINITINGVPFNDPESQGSFFVNLPDLASSASSIQIQRGVGTSTNGAGSFGGSININTNDTDTSRYLQYNGSYGSFNSHKSTLSLNSGLIRKHWIFNGRLSSISSNGYVDRANCNLRSFYTSAAYIDNHQSFRLNIFSGKEKTYAAWFGINQATLDSNRTFNPAGTEKPGAPYDNETDNYTQSHYQFFYNRKLNNSWKLNAALFLIRGKGYFEQYKAGQSLSAYGLPPYINGTDTTTESDLIRQLWLDNYFYGSVFSAHYKKGRTGIITGGNISRYDGNHFGDVVKTITTGAAPNGFRWYQLDARKSEISLYSKWTQQLKRGWQTFVDLQFRQVDYRINGFRNNPSLLIREQFAFFNPKLGIQYLKNKNNFYLSFAKASKEPNRDDFEANANQLPKAEKLLDYELGWNRKSEKSSWSVNLFYMRYKDQLVLTGKVNDVFAYTRTNIANSYRRGIELEGSKMISKWLQVSAYLTWSENKLLDYTDYIDNYDNGTQESTFYKKSDISFSPDIYAGYTLSIEPIKDASIRLNGRYVGAQYLDNTGKDGRKLDAYFVQDLQFNYKTISKKKNEYNFFIQLNNLFSSQYVANGYSFSYRYNGEVTTENYFFPMATFNWMAGIGIKL
jgi:iron complex outermembrane receptor protein